jgi:hypothetical protein
MSYNGRTIGEERQGFPDLWCWGHACAIGVLIAMLGPFYWLSGFYTSHIGYNPIYKSNIQLWLDFNETQIYNDGYHAGNQSQAIRVFLNESPIIFTSTEEHFKDLGLDEQAETMFFEAQQIQHVVPTIFSDTNWMVSDQMRLALQKYSCIASM